MNNNSSTPIYFDQLNGIRFLAVFLVLIDHWFALSLPIPLGHLGVVIFFVLSGFLITRILFENADEIRAGKSSYWRKIKNFIIRRSLRIFPIYLIICAIGVFFSLGESRDFWPWLFTHSSNWYIIYYKKWLGVFDHFWSLAVEEQYYLLFPYFILLLNPRKYPFLFVMMLFIGFFSRFYFFIENDLTFREKYWYVNYVNPFSTIDCFGLGGLLAYLFHYKTISSISFKSIYLIASLVFVFFILLLNHSINHHQASFTYLVLERFIFAVFGLFLIARAVEGKNDMFGKFLKNSIVNYLGLISYGLYLYHNFIYNLFHERATLFGFFKIKFSLSRFWVFENQFSLFLINLVILIIVASLSWFFIEKPFNSLKNKFE